MTRPPGRRARYHRRRAVVTARGWRRELTMLALAAHLGVTPMSLYHHVSVRAGLLQALSNSVYIGVLPEG